jgi:hypothetical protein
MDDWLGAIYMYTWASIKLKKVECSVLQHSFFINSILSLTDWMKNNLKLGGMKLTMFLFQINTFIASDCEFAAGL